MSGANLFNAHISHAEFAMRFDDDEIPPTIIHADQIQRAWAQPGKRPYLPPNMNDVDIPAERKGRGGKL